MFKKTLMILSLFWSICLFASYPDFSGAKQGDLFKLIAPLLPEDPIIIEAGAHNGEDTVRMAAFWPQGIVHAFEPNPKAFVHLKNRLNWYANIRPYPFALYNQEGTFTFYVNQTGGNDGASSLLEAADWMLWYYKDEVIEVPCMTLDTWQSQNNISHVDFIWFDLEGVELQVLQAASKLLPTCRVIFTEVNHREYRVGMTQYEDLKSFLNEHGFEEVHKWDSPPAEQENVVFIRRDLLDLEH